MIAASSDNALAEYEETTPLTIFTPLISFLLVLISLLAVLALIAFFTDIGNTLRARDVDVVIIMIIITVLLVRRSFCLCLHCK